MKMSSVQIKGAISLISSWQIHSIIQCTGFCTTLNFILVFTTMFFHYCQIVLNINLIELRGQFSGLRGFLLSLFYHSVMSDSLQPHGLQHLRLSGPSPAPSFLKLMSIKSMMPSNYLILRHPLLLPLIFPSNRLFSNESVLHIRRPKY